MKNKRNEFIIRYEKSVLSNNQAHPNKADKRNRELELVKQIKQHLDNQDIAAAMKSYTSCLTNDTDEGIFLLIKDFLDAVDEKNIDKAIVGLKLNPDILSGLFSDTLLSGIIPLFKLYQDEPFLTKYFYPISYITSNTNPEFLERLISRTIQTFGYKSLKFRREHPDSVILQNIIFGAITEGNFPITKFLIERFYLSKEYPTNLEDIATFFNWAIYNSNTDIIKYFVEDIYKNPKSPLYIGKDTSFADLINMQTLTELAGDNKLNLLKYCIKLMGENLKGNLPKITLIFKHALYNGALETMHYLYQDPEKLGFNINIRNALKHSSMFLEKKTLFTSPAKKSNFDPHNPEDRTNILALLLCYAKLENFSEEEFADIYDALEFKEHGPEWRARLEKTMETIMETADARLLNFDLLQNLKDFVEATGTDRLVEVLGLEEKLKDLPREKQAQEVQGVAPVTMRVLGKLGLDSPISIIVVSHLLQNDNARHLPNSFVERLPNLGTAGLNMPSTALEIQRQALEAERAIKQQSTTPSTTVTVSTTVASSTTLDTTPTVEPTQFREKYEVERGARQKLIEEQEKRDGLELPTSPQISYRK
jgi:hypothetical protein